MRGPVPEKGMTGLMIVPLVPTMTAPLLLIVKVLTTPVLPLKLLELGTELDEVEPPKIVFV